MLYLVSLQWVLYHIESTDLSKYIQDNGYDVTTATVHVTPLHGHPLCGAH